MIGTSGLRWWLLSTDSQTIVTGHRTKTKRPHSDKHQIKTVYIVIFWVITKEKLTFITISDIVVTQNLCKILSTSQNLIKSDIKTMCLKTVLWKWNVR